MACISKRRDRWVIDFYDNRGKRRWKTLPKGSTKANAKEAMRDIEDQVKKGIYLPERKTPLFSEVAQSWLEQKKLNVRITTWNMYEGHIKIHFNSISNYKINRITTAIVEKFITEKQTSGMNLTTLKKIIVTFNQIMKYAVRHGYIDYNPVRDAERPKKRGKIEDSEIIVLTPSQIAPFLENVTGLKYRTLFMLAIMAGPRQGEILGLKWSDVDWKNCQLHIQRTYNKRKWYQPKTASSNRKIDLGPIMITALKKWKLACPPNELDLIFPSKLNQPLAESSMVKRFFKPALKKAGLPDIRFHDLRHTFASLLIEQGENLKYIQTQLGHSDPTVTLKVYAHLMKPVNQESACKLENTIFGTTGSKVVAEIKKDVTVNSATS